MCYHTIEAGCQKALVLQRWEVDRIDRACVDVDTSKIGAMFDASDNPRVEFTCHDVVTTRVVSTCADVGTSNVYSRCHVNMMSKNADCLCSRLHKQRGCRRMAGLDETQESESGKQKDGESVTRDA